MPAERLSLAGDDTLRVERVRAPGHGNQWGEVHRSPNRRWILPGTGGVQMRSGAGQLLVDELTAFHLARGQDYQLQHEAPRAHLVLSRSLADEEPPAKAWLVAPRELYRLRLAARALREGAALEGVARDVDVSLARSRALATDPAPVPLQRARRLLMAEGGHAQRLEVLGEAAACSPFHLSRLFVRHLGVSPHQYRLQLRLATALGRLEDGEHDLAGLAHDLGFASQSHFGAVFRRAIGVTPAQARKALV
ncbi:helix-turn-helix transcriptional regulator [Ramlibacter humi]|uniref:AraC family transcriptional regulator n=1 Tax=Ramlibacter humi TaxID=2530451 RepID=A0A4Z0CCY3_9BURK|nr:AraC family transcriptional regulator [Ramlibacter humi]TFZ08125.1 AraC family transcriptional regulator [Ramlibacter humi]